MIIVEGPDLIGKTTLCKALVKRLNEHGRPHIYTHFSRLPAEWYRSDPLSLYWQRASRHIVQDRFHMSEPLYATIRGDAPILSPAAYSLLDARLRGELGMMTILMYDAFNGELIQSRWREGEMYPIDKVLAVNALYADLGREASQRWIDYHMPYDCVIPLGVNTDYAALIDVFVSQYIERQFTLDRTRW